MRLLLLNPNTTEAVTERLAGTARAAAGAGTQIIPLTAPRGVPFIASRAEAQIAGVVALEMLAEHHGRYDAAIIAAFADPGLFAARELFDAPIVGLAEAAMLTACMLGRRFSIVTFTTSMGPLVQGMRRPARARRTLRLDPHAERRRSSRSPACRRRKRKSW